MKKPARTVLSFFVVSIFAAISCKQDQTGTMPVAATLVSPDSLISQWNSSWNKHDSMAIINMFTDHSSVILNDKVRLKGIDAIKTGWLRESLPGLANLQTENFSSASGTEFAYYAGNYSLDRVRTDSAAEKGYGCFTMIWKLQPDNAWKVELLFFGEYSK